MTDSDKLRYQIRADIMKALAHPTRLFILNLLKDGEKCVCEINEKTGSDMSTISKHLSLLKKEGMIQDRKQGNNVYYRLKCVCIEDFFSCMEKVLLNRASETRACC